MKNLLFGCMIVCAGLAQADKLSDEFEKSLLPSLLSIQAYNLCQLANQNPLAFPGEFCRQGTAGRFNVPKMIEAMDLEGYSEAHKKSLESLWLLQQNKEGQTEEYR